MNIREEVKRLALEVPSPPNERLPNGATAEAIAAFQERTGLVLPVGFADWLLFTNGACIGPGGILGIEPRRQSLDIEQVLRGYPPWKLKAWIPVAGDGLGNYYISHTQSGGAIYFIDAAADANRLSYVAASEFWRFLWFLLMRELGQKGWPFARGYVVSNDPEILRCTGAALPWE